MPFTDSHTHLYDDQLVSDQHQIQRAIDAGVTKMYMPNCDSTTIDGMLRLADKYPTNCFPMMGLHPTSVRENYKDELVTITEWLQKRKFYAVGEIGLDYYWELTYKNQQIEAFKAQIDLALQFDLPIVIHSRESLHDCIDIVKRKQNGYLRGVFHCFSGTLDQANEIISLGFYVGIGGVLTFRHSPLVEIVNEIPLANILLETDAPYLAPAPHRSKRNESSYIPIIAQKIADIKNITLEGVAGVTTYNAEKVFGSE
jgi:TatD DNase family protein